MVMKGLMSIFFDYVSFTSLHGLPQITNDFNYIKKAISPVQLTKRSIEMSKCFSMIVWVSSVTICSFLAVAITGRVWQRWNHTSTLTSVDTYYYPITNIPFPAVTFCNLNIVYRPILERTFLGKMVESGFNRTILNQRFSELNAFVRYRNMDIASDILYIRQALLQFNMNLTVLMLKLMQPCDQMIRYCDWLNRGIPCNELFKVVQTSKGYCCSFNYKDNTKFTDEDSFHVTGAGDNVGLELSLWPEPDEYVTSIRNFYGIAMDIHHPEDYPDMKKPTYLQPGYDFRVYVTPSVVTSDKDLRRLSLSDRKCLFENEKNLMIRKKYNYNACILDCRVEYIVKLCNCIPYFYPYFHIPKYSHLTNCKYEALNCLRQIRSYVASIAPSVDAVGFDQFFNRSEIGLKCNCMPGCNEIRYKYSVIQTNRRTSPTEPLNRAKFNAIGNNPFLNVTSVLIAFKDVTCVAYKRTVHMSWDNFFASVGGIFGLCLGASIISLIEAIYFGIVHFFKLTIFTAFANSSKEQTKIMPIKKNKLCIANHQRNRQFHYDDYPGLFPYLK